MGEGRKHSADDVAIRVSNLSKCYQIYDRPQDRLKQSVVPRFQRLIGRTPSTYFRDFWALRDVSFEVKKGDSVGIIGRNGSGKSTLLQIICGTLTPAGGTVQTSGRTAALLELGSGFNPEFTGRENVYMNAAVLGLAREETESRFDDIAAFADIGQFIEQPVRTYSSGMLVRLAFAVQVELEPEILIVDEVLSVGDYFFQQKCFGRLRKMREKGLTLLFVSHDMGTVRNFCSTAVYLRKGKLEFVGDCNTAVRAYLAEQSLTASQESAFNVSQTTAPSAPIPALTEIKQAALWSVSDDAEGSRRLLAVRLLNSDGQLTTHAIMGDTIKMQVFFRTAPGETGLISVTLKNRFDQIIFNTSTYLMGMEPCSSGNAHFAVAEFEISLMLEAGLYSLRFSYGQPTQENQGKVIDNTGWIGPLHITWDYETQRAPFLGMFGLPARAKVLVNERHET
jgi:lipopolysaccharide transport system ATP-binding protein